MKQLKFPRVNSAIISGRLTRETELRYTSNSIAVTKLPIAFDRSYQREGEWVQETSYIDVVVWDKLAVKCVEELEKGSPILVEGYLKTHTYQDKNNQNRKVTEIVAFKVNFLEKSPNSGTADVHSAKPDSKEPKSNITDDDVPF